MSELSLFESIEERLKRSKIIRCAAIVPKKTAQWIGSELYSRSKWSSDLRRFKDIHAGERCFIIGNGPSLTIDDLETISNEFCFCANLAYKLFDKTSFRPTYYVAADKFFFPTYYNELIGYTGIEDYFFAKESARRVNLPANAHCLNITGPFTVVKGSMKNDDFSIDPSDHLAMSYTVTYYSIQLAVYMGFKTIYLLGVDHNYANSVDRNGVLHKGDENARSYANGMGVPAGAGWNYVDSTTYSYHVADLFARTHGVSILNATRGGKLEVFPRVNLDDLFN